MSAYDLKWRTDIDQLKIGQYAWDSSRTIRVIKIWEGQIWNFYAPATDSHGRTFSRVESSVFVPHGEPA